MDNNFLTCKHVVGLKQTLLNLSENNCKILYVAVDCDNVFKQTVFSRCKGKNVEIVQKYTKAELGRLCNIDVDCGVVAVLKS